MKKSIGRIFLLAFLMSGYFITICDAAIVKIKPDGGIKVAGIPAVWNGMNNTWTCGADTTLTCFETNATGGYMGSGGPFYLSGGRINIFIYTDVVDRSVGYGFVNAITANTITDQNFDTGTLNFDSQTQQVTSYLNWINLLP